MDTLAYLHMFWYGTTTATVAAAEPGYSVAEAAASTVRKVQMKADAKFVFSERRKHNILSKNPRCILTQHFPSTYCTTTAVHSV